MKIESDISILIKILFNQVSSVIEGYQNFLLAFSGGLDSTVLLDILTKLRNRYKKKEFYSKFNSINIRAIHVDHGINKNSKYWKIHCMKQCGIHQVPLRIISVKVDTEHSSVGIESEARYMRYKTLYENLNTNEVLLTAHHLNDQVETFFLALKRGSGPSGLSSMAKDTLLSDGSHLLRPLLSCKREWIELYAYSRKILWIEDDSNIDIRFDRNFLRLHIIPFFSKRWPNFLNLVERSAQLCSDQEKLIDELLVDDLEKSINNDGSLLINNLVQMSVYRRNALLRRWLINFNLRMPSLKKLKCIWNEVALSRRDAVPNMKLDDWILRRFRDRLYCIPIKIIEPIFEKKLLWQESRIPLILPNNIGILTRYLSSSSGMVCIQNKFFSSLNINNKAFVTSQYKFNNIMIKYGVLNSRIFSSNIIEPLKIVATCVVRAPLFNEIVSIRFVKITGLIHIVGRHRGRKIKKLWQELDIPPWLRERIPLLFYEEKFIAALGVFLTSEKENCNYKKKWRIYWLQTIPNFPVCNKQYRL